MSHHSQLALRDTITLRQKKRIQTMKTSMWSCGSSPHVLTDSLRCVMYIQTLRIMITIAANGVTLVNESTLYKSVCALMGNKTYYSIWKFVPPHSCCPLTLTPLNIVVRLCIYFPLANQMCGAFWDFFSFI